MTIPTWVKKLAEAKGLFKIAKGTIEYIHNSNSDTVIYTCECGTAIALTAGEGKICYSCGRQLVATKKIEVHERCDDES